MKVFILLLIFGTGRTDGGLASVTQKYDSLAQCQAAASLIVKQKERNSGYIYVLTCSESGG